MWWGNDALKRLEFSVFQEVVVSFWGGQRVLVLIKVLTRFCYVSFLSGMVSRVSEAMS